MIDFTCAFTGALIYFIFFKFLIENLGIPFRVVSLQATANLVYGIFGFLIFLTKTQRKSIFRTLIFLNIAYALVCVGLSIRLFLSSVIAGSALLLVEGVFILFLANFEWQSLQKIPNDNSWKNQA